MARRRNIVPIKAGRYGNVTKPMYNGIKFDSGTELKRYLELQLLEVGGAIRDLQVHPKYPITIAGVEIRIYSKRYHKTGRHLTYEADFAYYDCEKKKDIIEDVKMRQHRTETYRIKKALMRAMGYDITEI